MIAGARRAVDYCHSVGADLVKLAIQFCVAHPAFATTLVGTANADLIRQNVAYLDEPIDFALMARVLELLQPIKNHNFTRGRPENRDPVVP
jgi:L-galactose dehydrogenase